VPANRISTLTSADVSVASPGWAVLRYDTSASRWRLLDVWPVTATATNAMGSLWTNGAVVTASLTNISLIYGSNIIARATNTAGNVDLLIAAGDQPNQNAVDSVSTNGVDVT